MGGARLKPALPFVAPWSRLRAVNGLLHLCQQARLFSAQHAFERQPVGRVVAAKYHALEFQRLQQVRCFTEQSGLFKRLPLREFFAKTRLNGWTKDRVDVADGDFL